MSALLTLERVERRYPGTGPVLEPTSLKVAPGEFVALLGPSGCGKSTLLRLIAGLDDPSEGHIGIGAPGSKVVCSFVFQDPTLLPWRDVRDNVALPLELGGVPKKMARRKAEEALARVRLADAAGKHPVQLSGGMRMRVSVARALVTEPTLLLLDEPFAALDEMARHELQDELHGLWRTTRMTTIFVTHSVAEAAYMATRTVVLSSRPAKVLLDRASELGEERGLKIRTDPRYIHEMEAIYDAISHA